MGNYLSRLRGNNQVAVRFIPAQPGEDHTRKRTTVRPPKRYKVEFIEDSESGDSSIEPIVIIDDPRAKVDAIIDSVDDFSKKWDRFEFFCIVMGIPILGASLYFGVPAFYKFVESNLHK